MTMHPGLAQDGSHPIRGLQCTHAATTILLMHLVLHCEKLKTPELLSSSVILKMASLK